MRLQNYKTQERFKEISAKVCLAMSIAFFLIGSIGMAYRLAQASQSEYSLVGNNVVLDGTNDGSTRVALKTSVAREYVGVQGVWSLHEVVGTGETQTSYFNLSGMTRGGSIAAEYGETNGAIAWISESATSGMSVAAGGEVFTATYTVDKNTPAGTYKISFSKDDFIYYANGAEEIESDAIVVDATVTVTRSEGTNNNENNNNENNGNENNNETGNNENESSSSDEENNTSVAAATESDSGNSSDSGLAVPDTGRLTQDDNGANAITIASVMSFAVAIGLFVVTVRMKSHKKVGFDKIK